MSLTPPSSIFLPLVDRDNCTIEYDIESAVTTDLNGFPIVTKTTGQLRARVFNDEGVTDNDTFGDGKDLSGEKLKGRLHDPKLFPVEVKNLSLVRLVFDDGRIGTARIKIKTPNPISKGSEIYGQSFEMLFRGE